ncbi:MAG: S-methyl-5-thioribose-1-phosphate isomerase [Methanobacteriota archaeon]|nr:MAG: S-methyl-5-thioribose-1-phosphate isomerase [Euryarchaeota archaeon]
MKVVLEGEEKEIETVWMEGETVKLIDQRILPDEFKIFSAGSVEEVAFAIEDMVVRGAPAIGATAAYGMALAKMLGREMDVAASILKDTRPTAHDLFHAVNHMEKAIQEGLDPASAARRYADDITARCKKIGMNGNNLIKDGDRILTHCNAGALATVDFGTALAPIRAAHRSGKGIFVWADETRPRCQGASLTSWELLQEGIPHAIIADNAAGYYMRKGEVNLAIVGADRVAGNGDVANKIGTYEKAVVAKENGIPFYVAAPASTFDFSLSNGDQIPIEERSPEEVLVIRGKNIAPEGAEARNPAFDVTPAKYIAGYITEKGVLSSEELIMLSE